jgi:hypothetical protein
MDPTTRAAFEIRDAETEAALDPLLVRIGTRCTASTWSCRVAINGAV